MLGILGRYARWLHTGWPAGTVEKLPVVREDGTTNVPGLYVTGDLTGIPLLKFSADSGARAIQAIAADPAFQALRQQTRPAPGPVHDVVIVGGGVSGMAAALEARALGLDHVLLEAAEPFSTIVNFPARKPIYTYPTEMVPAGQLSFTAQVKEPLVEELRRQTLAAGVEPRAARAECVRREGDLLRVVLPEGQDDLLARRVVVAIGRSGNFRRLGAPGEELDKVSNRLHDPKDYAGRDVLVVGGGDSALEAAIALVQSGARVTLSYRKAELSRPKPENADMIRRLAADPAADVEITEPSSERVTTATGRYLGRLRGEPGRLEVVLASTVDEITPDEVRLKTKEGARTLPNQAVFAMIGREAPLDFFRRSGVEIRGEWRAPTIAAFAAFLLLCTFIYLWKGQVVFKDAAFPAHAPQVVAGLGPWWKAKVADRASVIGTLAVSMKSPSFYYTLTYCVLMAVFGWRRIRRRKTRYVTAQTLSLLAFQLLPLFLLPELILPLLGYSGAFRSGIGQQVADSLFPLYVKSDAVWPDWGHPRAYWKAYGLILAWPLNAWNVLTETPQWGWLAVSGVQTFVLIPLLVWRFGKGAYCGWICSCGGLAETMGDAHRHKMPHGPLWNRLNLVGQVILGVAVALLALRIVGWAQPHGWADRVLPVLFKGEGANGSTNPLSYKWTVDVLLGGVLGIGCYFWLSGRVWCRFACPLAALMHIYARFSQFRILADKKKCISCNVCTSVCHQGIDIMNFANKGVPMEDPECVRCSACVQSCPTGVLEFGRVDREGEVLGRDWLQASPVRAAEGKRLPLAS